jgi:hypothetical protein
MMRRVMAVFALGCCVVAAAADGPRSYAEAEATWERVRGDARYQSYSTEFAQYNNSLRLDERDDCYSLGSGPVGLMLVIAGPDADGFATIERVFADVDNAKARCFQRAYTGVRTKLPPFLPFVLQLAMG